MSNVFVKLLLYVEDPELKNVYMNKIEKHNNNVKKRYFDSGFDLFNPDDITFEKNSWGKKIDLGVVASAHLCPFTINEVSNFNDYSLFKPCGFYMFPRSSISKTPIRLSNSTGIIDSGYRGNLIGAFDNISNSDCFFEKHSRLIQICGPGLCPIYVELVDDISDLGTTERGSGGFGSTGN